MVSLLFQLNKHASFSSGKVADAMLKRTRCFVGTTRSSSLMSERFLLGSQQQRHVRHCHVRCFSVYTASFPSSSSSSSHRTLKIPYFTRIPNLHHQQRRHVASSTWLPEALANFSIWGGSGWMLKTLHMDGLVPYWACFAIINVMVRLLLFPLVLHGAHTSARFARVVPEVQFLITLFSNDMKKLRQRNAPWAERLALMGMNFQTLGGIYKLHNINPFAVFLSPLLQLPIFWYLSVDLRKIVNGLDPQLAQTLVDSPVAWIPDLTEADPWYGLPVLAGVLLYANVEVAVGQKSLAGPSTAKADTAVLLKDVFQSFAVFMPCFTSQMPAGIQIYLATSFLFTMGQSAALRNASFRSMFALPPLAMPGDASLEPKYAQQLIKLKQLEQKAREIRGDGPLLGKGVLAHNFECSFPGTYRKSTIEVVGNSMPVQVIPSTQTELSAMPQALKASWDVSSSPFANLPYIHGVSAPPWQLAEQKHLFEPNNDQQSSTPAVSLVGNYSDEIMEKANRGELPVATRMVDASKVVATSSQTRRNPVRVNRKLAHKGTKKRR